MKTSFWQKLSYMSKKDKGFVKKAFLFAQKAHQNQKRTSGELYFNHPLRVAKYLADYKMEKEVIAAGLLHDVCEDTKISLERIKQEFGKEVANLVDGVSVIGRIQTKARLNFAGSENERKNILRLQKLILSSIKDIRVIFIRLLDRKDNLKTLDVFPAEKQKRKAQETLLIYAPLAKKIEMGKLGGELEDMAFKYLYPETYKQVKKVRDKNLPIAHSAIQLLEKTIMKELEKTQIKVLKSDYRVKYLYSLYQKLKRHNMDISQIYDLVALRIIVSSKEDCYRALGIIHDVFPPVPGRIKDYIARPKPNGYQSLHTTVFVKKKAPVEVQIRTLKMHHQAEHGLAAHWLYKEKYPAKDIMGWLKTLKLALKKNYNLKKLFADNIYVFTPMGEIVELPQGATVLDFAYAIHTEVGERAKMGFVNGQIKPLDFPLHNRQVVEIKTANTPQVSSLWLDKVKTQEAKAKIRSFLKKQNRGGKIKEAKKSFLEQLKFLGITEKRWEEKKKSVLNHFYLKEEDFFLKFYEGEVKLQRVVNRFFLSTREEAHPTKKKSLPKVLVAGEKNIKTKIAQCCQPQPHQSIVGYVSRKKEISIHHSKCPMLAFLDKDKIIPAWWQGKEEELEIAAWDRPGLLKDVAEIFSKRNINILVVESKKPVNHLAKIRVVIERPVVLDLTKLAEDLKSVQGVKKIAFSNLK